MSNLKNTKKAIILLSNSQLKIFTKFSLVDIVECIFFNSASDAKYFLKSYDDVRLIILDWAMQDKYGSLMKCLVFAKSKKNILIVNIFTSDEQRKYVFSRFPDLINNNKIYSVSSEFTLIKLWLTLYKIKKMISCHDSES